MNYIIVLLLAWNFSSFLTPIPILARYFGSSARLLPFFLMNNELFPILAQSFLRVQGVCLPDTGYVLSYIEDVRTGKNNAVIAEKNRQKKRTANMKTKPFQSHSKPFFQRPKPILSEIIGIFDKFRKTFLCKTKPFFSKIQIKNKGLTAVSQSSEAAL